jgi:hypothetical protein
MTVRMHAVWRMANVVGRARAESVATSTLRDRVSPHFADVAVCGPLLAF